MYSNHKHIIYITTLYSIIFHKFIQLRSIVVYFYMDLSQMIVNSGGGSG